MPSHFFLFVSLRYTVSLHLMVLQHGLNLKRISFSFSPFLLSCHAFFSQFFSISFKRIKKSRAFFLSSYYKPKKILSCCLVIPPLKSSCVKYKVFFKENMCMYKVYRKAEAKSGPFPLFKRLLGKKRCEFLQDSFLLMKLSCIISYHNLRYSF